MAARKTVTPTVEDIIAAIHEFGAKTHREAWMLANRAAVSAMRECGVDPADSKNKLLVSRILLRVLNQLRPAAGTSDTQGEPK